MRGLLPVLIYALIAVCVIALLGMMAWAARRGRPSAGGGEHTVLFHYTIVLRTFSFLAAFGIPAGITALVIAFPPKRSEVGYVVGVYALFAGMSLPLYWETSRFYILISPEGIERRSAWMGLRFIAWDEVDRVTYSKMNGWFVLHAENGDKIRVSMLVSGVDDLLRLAEMRLPASVLKPARVGYERLGRPFPKLDDEPILESRPPRRRGEW
jgi:hypothetical protein